ncbi:hypothetical protein TREES_T100003882 [Tupaia chinensis]|uniref:Uncharacterized protein n=1 Tax=Tupaia chinensis TaxID=246437 RepID=L9L405_TUPCH|nr:hypothetical protein TREES_T100003882 [Tupaia chinensis]
MVPHLMARSTRVMVGFCIYNKPPHPDSLTSPAPTPPTPPFALLSASWIPPVPRGCAAQRRQRRWGLVRILTREPLYGSQRAEEPSLRDHRAGAQLLTSPGNFAEAWELTQISVDTARLQGGETQGRSTHERSGAPGLSAVTLGVGGSVHTTAGPLVTFMQRPQDSGPQEDELPGARASPTSRHLSDFQLRYPCRPVMRQSGSTSGKDLNRSFWLKKTTHLGNEGPEPALREHRAPVSLPRPSHGRHQPCAPCRIRSSDPSVGSPRAPALPGPRPTLRAARSPVLTRALVLGTSEAGRGEGGPHLHSAGRGEALVPAATRWPRRCQEPGAGAARQQHMPERAALAANPRTLGVEVRNLSTGSVGLAGSGSRPPGPHDPQRSAGGMLKHPLPVRLEKGSSPEWTQMSSCACLDRWEPGLLPAGSGWNLAVRVGKPSVVCSAISDSTRQAPERGDQLQAELSVPHGA